MREFRWILVAVSLLLPSCAGEEPEPANSGEDRTAEEASAEEGEGETAIDSESISERNDPSEEIGTQLAPPQLLDEEEYSGGWLQLFDGQTLFGWEANSDTQWRVKEGIIVAEANQPAGLLVTTSPFSDYEFRCEYRLETGGNSGVFLRTVVNPTNPAVDCYELNMCDSHPEYPTGSLVGREKVTGVSGEGEWKSWHVQVEGNHIVARLDGVKVLDFNDDSEHQLNTGRIGLQKNEGKIEFRNVAVKPLGLVPIFNGTDLTGWREIAGSNSEFRVVDETIHVTAGRGFLETESTWGDFVLQFDVKTNGDQLNSGLFFRAIEQTDNGYEVQIHNGFAENDRTRPVDQGTGAIFRRQPARWVVSNDREWTTIILIASGPHFATWVNGFPVVDWTDTRPDDENPRRGRRLAPGHINLQGHDPSTDLNFRRLEIAPLPERESH